MPRTNRQRTPSAQKPARPSAAGLDEDELRSLVCGYLCGGMQPADIPKALADEHGITLSREKPYRIIVDAAARGMLRYTAPHKYDLETQLRASHPWLAGVVVAHSATMDDVAQHAADVVIDQLRQRARPPLNQTHVHIGFAGGGAMRSVARCLAARLREQPEFMPQVVVFHALVAGFDWKDPTTAPNAFFTFFVQDPAMKVRTEFVGLLAPPFVQSRQVDELSKLVGFKEAWQQRDKLDIIVTSGASWGDPCEHSMLRAHMDGGGLDELLNRGCIGDLLWRPISGAGPITQRTQYRAMTLLELDELPGHIARGASVVFMLGPCRVCHQPRGRFLRAVLDLQPQLISHVVTDSRSAAQALE